MRRKFCFYCIILLTSLIVLPSSVAVDAQTTDPEWRYAYNNDANQLVAYTPDGTVTELTTIEGDSVRLNLAIEFADNNALIRFEVAEDSYVYVHITPQNAGLVPMDPTYFWIPITQTDRYVVLRGNENLGDDVPALLYDSETRQVQQLQGFSRYSFQSWCCDFSADGQTLRYLSFPHQGANDWQIIQRDLASGTEQVFFAPDVTFADDGLPDNIFTFTAGQQWYWRHVDDATQDISFNVVHNDGMNEVIQTYNRETPPPTRYAGYGDFIVQITPDCEEDCTLIVESVDDEAVTLQRADHFPSSLTRPNETTFLMIDGTDYYLLKTDSPPQLIGVRSPFVMLSDNILSPDDRWLTLLDKEDDPEFWFIWDTLEQAPVYVAPNPPDDLFFIYRISYYPTSQMIHVGYGRTDTFVIFDYTTGEAMTLPIVENETRSYFEVLSDGAVLLTRYDRETSTPLGIWRYDPMTEEMTQVLADGSWRPITFQ